MRRLGLCSIALLILLVLPAAAARASAYTTVLGIYEQTGTVPACKFSSRELTSALKGVDTYGAQYFADFTNAIQTALAARASGQCSADRSLLQALAGAPTGGSGHSPTAAPPGSVTAATGADIPAPIALLAVLGGLCVLIASIGGLAHLRGWEPASAGAWRHAWSEAGYRTAGTWSEFRDWLRSA